MYRALSSAFCSRSLVDEFGVGLLHGHGIVHQHAGQVQQPVTALVDEEVDLRQVELLRRQTRSRSPKKLTMEMNR